MLPVRNNLLNKFFFNDIDNRPFAGNTFDQQKNSDEKPYDLSKLNTLLKQALLPSPITKSK